MECDPKRFFGLHVPQRKVERQVKVLIKNLAIFFLCAQLHLLAEPPRPRIWAHIRGRFWSAMIDEISL
jgi:hypothetical protein